MENHVTVKEELVRILERNILPFWVNKTIDRFNGGYVLNHDIAGNIRDEGNSASDSSKYLVTQARQTYLFSKLVNMNYDPQRYLPLATHGCEFLKSVFWDRDNGGCYWAVTQKGIPIMRDKLIYGQAFALYAFSEYALATNDLDVKDHATRLFLIMEEKAHDKEHGGYLETFTEDWRTKPHGMNYLNSSNSQKLMNTHLHMMEAITKYHQLVKNPIARERLLELIIIQSGTVLRKNIGACTDTHGLDWTPNLTARSCRVSYGHILENVWLLLEACREAVIPEALFMDCCNTLFDYVLQYGFDNKNGGFYESGPFEKTADKKSKLWWVQAEGLYSALVMFERTRKLRYLDCFSKTLHHIVQRQADWKTGEWHHEVTPKGERKGPKAGQWKCGYHNGRAIIQSIDLIEKMNR